MEKFYTYIQIFLRGWWIILLTVTTATAITWVISSRKPPVYRTALKLIISPNLSSVKGTKDIIDSIEALSRGGANLPTYAEVLSSHRFKKEACKALSLPIEQTLAAYEFSAVVLPSASALKLTVLGPDPQTAVLLLNEVQKRAVEYIHTLYPVYTVHLFEPAWVPNRPIEPNPQRDASLAAGLAVILGAILSVLYTQWLQRHNREVRKDENHPAYSTVIDKKPEIR